MHKTLKTYFKKEANTKKGLDDQVLGLDHMKGVKAQVGRYPLPLEPL